MASILLQPRFDGFFPPFPVKAAKRVEKRMSRADPPIPETIANVKELALVLKQLDFFRDDLLDFTIATTPQLGGESKMVHDALAEIQANAEMTAALCPRLFDEFAAGHPDRVVTKQALLFAIQSYSLSIPRVFAMRFVCFLSRKGLSMEDFVLNLDGIRGLLMDSFEQEIIKANVMLKGIVLNSIPQVESDIGREVVELFEKFVRKSHDTMKDRMDSDLLPLFLRIKGGNTKSMTLEEYTAVMTPANLDEIRQRMTVILARKTDEFQREVNLLVESKVNQRSRRIERFLG